jgi:hypothetical protein
MENEKTLEILVAYRENDSFKEYVPVIEKTLESLNYKIERKVFPKETSQESIETWFKDNSEEIKKYGWRLTDETTASSICDIQWNIWPENRTLISTIDTFLRNATINAILGEGRQRIYKGVIIEKGTEAESDYLRNLKNAYVNIVKNVSKKPNEVVIIKQRIRQHDFNYLGSGDDKIGPKEAEAASILKGFFEEAGIPKVTIVDRPKDITEEMERNKKSIWIVKDRHLRETDFQVGGFIELKNPITDFYDSVYEYGLIDSDKLKKNEIALEIKNILVQDINHILNRLKDKEFK